ncbi:hypothetical protein L207DRAFT_618243 [Hyaloscypha variabilis F]|uniref:2EXR domain-containing protein n=1 Tax=Hyaloscypha variabilis (strain UAMH 11265 / GT02V1 / F) TaxID=1149755 RepID=A0A2J6QRW8_HYAVF|nr:hypothetical protein L207DRAFT_618243 [Hyaloscypha variabilis F]
MDVKKIALSDLEAETTRTGQEESEATDTEENSTMDEEEEGALVSFTVFPKLPLELRLMVWRFALPESQFIAIGPGHCEYCRKEIIRDSCSEHAPTGPSSMSFDLSISHTNHESRQLSLRTHAFCFFSGVLQRPLYFNFCQDVLFFKSESVLEDFQNRMEEASPGDKGIVQQIKRIMVAMPVTNYRLSANTLRFLHNITNIRQVGVVYGRYHHAYTVLQMFEDLRTKFQKRLQTHLQRSWHEQKLSQVPAVTLNLLHPVRLDPSDKIVAGGAPKGGNAFMDAGLAT